MRRQCLWLLLLTFWPSVAGQSSQENQQLIDVVQRLQGKLHSWRRHLEQRSVHYLEQTDDAPEFTHEFVIRLKHGTPEDAKDLANLADYEYVDQVRGLRDTFLLRKRQLPERSKRDASEHSKQLADFEKVVWVEQQRLKRRVKRDFNNPDVGLMFNDPYWNKQWPLHDTRTERNLPKLDLHVIGAWKQGFTGKGVVVTILDDGIQHNHTDLAKNYDARASYDLNDNDADPMPTFNDYNKHGTRCAGEVAMVANNRVCGVGVAFDAKIGGIRMLDGKVTDRLEAEALMYHIDHIHIFSASWGPNDDGRTVEGPGTLAERAIIKGITEGRGGKGTIYVWASGNGGSYNDDCNCDGYTDSIFTLSVSSASQSGRFPWYGEKCASTLATTYSSGAYSDQKITTTDIRNECTTEHTGTSASAPLAAGIVALGLQANSKLTWRDVQHITVWTSEPAPLVHNDGWHKNSRGLLASTAFGFGLMNADAFVSAAKKWKNVPTQLICTTTFPDFKQRKFHGDSPGVVRFRTDACAGQRNEIKYLEHLQLVTDIEHTRRGNLAIFLSSPNGTKTKLLSPRNRDNSKAGFRKWPFMSVHTWGEDPSGWWQLEVFDRNVETEGSNHGSINNLTMILYGTKEAPEHYKRPRKYNMDYNKVGDRAVHQKVKLPIFLFTNGIVQKRVQIRNVASEGAEGLIEQLEEGDPELSFRSIEDQLARVDRALDLLEVAADFERLRTEREAGEDDIYELPLSR